MPNEVLPPEPPSRAEVVTAQPKAGNNLNPFAGDRSLAQVGAGALAEVTRTVAEVQAAIMLAKQFPRDRAQSAEVILRECCRETLAEAATYSYTKGGQEVTGASIRLAEVLAQNWGNFQFGWDIVGRTDTQSEIVCFAWDAETNVRTSRKFTVKHWRDTKKGGYAIKDERDIYELCANQAARRLRACILNIIPGDMIEAALRQCEVTLASNEVVTPEKIKLLLTAFEGYGVSKAQIEKRMACKVEAFNGARMMQLRKIYNGLKDGMSKPEEFFEPDVAAEVAKPADGKKPTTQDGTPYDASTGEISDWETVVDEMMLGLPGAKNETQLGLFLAENDEALKKLNDSKDTKAQKKWATALAKRKAELNVK